METEHWTLAQRALAEALAVAFRPSKDTIRVHVDKVADQPQELVAELASVLCEYVEDKTLPNCLHLSDTLNAGKAIWAEWLAVRALIVGQEKRDAVPRERERPLPRIPLKRRFPQAP